VVGNGTGRRSHADPLLKLRQPLDVRRCVGEIVAHRLEHLDRGDGERLDDARQHRLHPGVGGHAKPIAAPGKEGELQAELLGADLLLDGSRRGRGLILLAPQE
jgi:hypothetical protein